MNYKITNFIPESAQVIIEVPGLAPFAVDLPIDDNGNVPVGEELTVYLSGFIPTWHLDRVNKISTGIKNIAEIQALVQPSDLAPLEISNPNLTENTSLKATIVEVLQELRIYTPNI